jgi:alanine dehydrogenase
MKIGVPKEIKVHEYRVGIVPANVRELVAAGHEVLVQSSAGSGIGKVKEPQPAECAMLRPGQLLFTYLHLAADPAQAEALMKSRATAIAYETVTADDGSLPLLTPMSEVAGRMSIQVGASCLEKEHGGSGILLAGVPGVAPAKVVILGGGVAGSNAAAMAVGLQADVTIVDLSVPRLRQLETQFGNAVKTVYSTKESVELLVASADLVIGSVLIPGAAAPKLVTREMVRNMRAGSALVDISIDQGGCFETSRPTTHADPTYIVDDVVHYCVTNMPGAVPRKGYDLAIRENPHLGNGVNVHQGKIMHEERLRSCDQGKSPSWKRC